MPKLDLSLNPASRADDPAADTGRNDDTHEVAADLAYMRTAIVNVVFFGRPGSPWTLVDTGIPGSAGAIRAVADKRFAGQPPQAIILTHGHFDHVGSARDLLKHWNVPVYIHEFERPYVDGTSAYQPPDPGVGGGMMASLSELYPRGPIDLGASLHTLPADGTVPGMPGWQWLPTPGHSPGHASLWRPEDKALIVADAFCTTAQESAYAVALQKPEIHGPPKYFTQNWDQARNSVRSLAALEPELAVPGHGRAMKGLDMRRALHLLADNFDAIAVPDHGVYVENPIHVEDGSAYRAT